MHNKNNEKSGRRGGQPKRAKAGRGAGHWNSASRRAALIRRAWRVPELMPHEGGCVFGCASESPCGSTCHGDDDRPDRRTDGHRAKQTSQRGRAPRGPWGEAAPKLRVHFLHSEFPECGLRNEQRQVSVFAVPPARCVSIKLRMDELEFQLSSWRAPVCP